MEQHICTVCGAPLRQNETRCRRCGRTFDPLVPGSVRTGEAGSGRPARAPRPSATGWIGGDLPLKGTPYEPVGLLGWLGILLLMLFPGVNVIFLMIWASGGCRKYTKRNFARAMMILIFFALILFLLAWLLFGSFWQRYLDLLYYYW